LAATAQACYTKRPIPLTEAAIFRRLRTLSRPLRHWLLLVFVLSLAKLFKALPRRLALGTGALVGTAVYALDWADRRRTIEHFRGAYPVETGPWHRRAARAVFAYWGSASADFFTLGSLSPAELAHMIAEVHGVEYLRHGMAEGQGIVIITPHLGHWEMMGQWVSAQRPLGVVARQLFDPRLDQALNAGRLNGGMRVFPRSTSAIPILRWLKDGNALGALADQDTSVDSLFCEFFGRPAKTPTGAVVLSQVTRSVLITGYCWRRPDGRYVIEFEPPIPVPERGERDPMALWPAAQEYTRRIEAKIRQHPEQWVWMHRRWHSPMDEDSNGWQKRHAQACRERMEAWAAAGRPELTA